MASPGTANVVRRRRGIRHALAAARPAGRAAHRRRSPGQPDGDGAAGPDGKEASGTRAAPTARRGVVTLLDQGVSSISNFAVAAVVARLTGAAGLGEFSLAYAGWQLLSALHRALVTDPMTVNRDLHDTSARPWIKRGFAAEVLLGLAGALCSATIGLLLVAAGAQGYGDAMLVVSPWLPILLLQDYWRWISFMGRQPGRALANDAVFNVVQGLGFAALFVLHLHSMAAVVASWGLGALAGVLYGLRQYRVAPGHAGGWTLLTERWHFSKWLAGDTLLNSLASQSNIILGGVILGPAGLGGLRAARTLVAGPSMVLLQAGGSLGLPEATHAYERHGWRGLHTVSWVVTGVGVLTTGACLAVVAIWGSSLLTLVYGPSFARYQLTSVLIGIGFVLVSFELGPLIVLKVTARTRWMFHVQVINLVTSLASMIPLSIAFGENGAATSIIVRSAASAAGCGWFQRKAGLAVRRQQGAPAGLPAVSGDVAGDPASPAPTPPGGSGAPTLPRRLDPSSEPIPS